VEFKGDRGHELKLITWGLLEYAAEKCGRTLGDLEGDILLTSNLPLGSGLGASAALCVGVGRWFEKLGWIQSQELYEFCRNLEDLFHGESSGVDIAVALSGRGLQFVRGGNRKELHPVWRPKFYLSYCGHRGVTAECVAKVKSLFENDRPLAEELDSLMHSAVDKAEEALNQTGLAALRQLAQAIDQAGECFLRWGLVDEDMHQHMVRLRQQGALAVKPTGSGAGGYVLSLWDREPSIPDLLSV